MKKEEIHLGDINRWLFGQAPGQFMIEVIIRTLLIYVILLVVVRLMGKRMSGQITLSETAVMITLGAIVAPVMQLPDRGILFGVVVLLAALAFQRGITLWGFKSEKVEHITQGVMSLLVKDGVINVDEMAKARITNQQLFAMLREKKIQNLGKVKRGYLEACGVFSVFEREDTTVGLPIYPQDDPAILKTQKPSPDSIMACCNCGHVQENVNDNTSCNVCHSNDWSKAYISEN
jgi:uncharacterized membrane protein YcaP (DUF421 family)